MKILLDYDEANSRILDGNGIMIARADPGLTRIIACDPDVRPLSIGEYATLKSHGLTGDEMTELLKKGVIA